MYHPTLMCSLLLFITIFAYGSNMLSVYSRFWPFNESMQSKGYCNSVSTQRNGNILLYKLYEIQV